MNDIQRLESITEANVLDLVGNKKILWLMKRIILDQEERIRDLEFEVADLNGKVEHDTITLK
jgi:hypothetical protein